MRSTPSGHINALANDRAPSTSASIDPLRPVAAASAHRSASSARPSSIMVHVPSTAAAGYRSIGALAMSHSNQVRTELARPRW
jgi:hypothetical protein